jgi:cell wall-associated NlpC family hydrolase
MSRNVSRIITLPCIFIFLFSACGTTQYAAYDFTKNHSRTSTGPVVTKVHNQSRAPHINAKIERQELRVRDHEVGLKKSNSSLSTPEESNNSRDASGERIALLEAAKAHVGTPYRFGGKAPGGFDCSGFTHYVFRSQNVTLPPNSSAQSRVGNRINPKEAQPGDLLIFTTKGKVNHVGMVVENTQGSLQMIHASSSQGIIVEDVLRSEYWTNRLAYAVNVLGS